MIVNIYISISQNELKSKILKFKENKINEGVKYYDFSTHSDNFKDKESFSLFYSDDDFIWCSKTFKTSKDFIRILNECNIKNKDYESNFYLNINREIFMKGYSYIKELVDFIGTDYIAVSDNWYNIFDLENGKIVKKLLS